MSFVNMKEIVKSSQILEREKDLEEFINKYNLRMNKKKRRQLVEQSTPEQYESYKIGLEVSFCCKDANLDKARTLYLRAKELNIRLPTHGYNNLLCLTAGLGEPGNGCQNQRYVESPHDIELATMIFQDMQTHNIDPTEAGYSALIRCYCQSNNPQYATKAIHIFQDLKTKKIHPKQRTFTALLTYFANLGDQEKCFSLFEEMQTVFEIIPTEKEYISLLRVCLSRRDSVAFYQTLLKMMDDLLLLYSEDTMEVIKQWFVTIEPDFQSKESLVDNNCQGLLLANGERLNSIDLDEETKKGLLEKLRNIAINRDPNHKYKPNNKIRELAAVKQLQQHLDGGHMEERQDGHEAPSASISVSAPQPDLASEGGEPEISSSAPTIDPDRLAKWEDFEQTLSKNVYDIIIDGANVGYYNQNYQGAPTHVDYLQIHQMVEVIVKQFHKKPLLILHSRHISEQVLRQVPAYQLNTLDLNHSLVEDQGQPQVQTTKITVKEMIQSWRDQKILYATPKSFNDDWFWMFATLKYNIPVITNDEMRDHHFQFLSPRYFIRWRERHRVRYNFFYRYPAALRQMLFGNGFTAHEQYDESDNESESEDNQNVDNAIGSTTTTTVAGLSRTLVNYNPAYRKINLKWPLTYSYRMQYIDSDHCEGYYFPPVIHQLPSHAPLISNKRERENTDDGNHGSMGVDLDDTIDKEPIKSTTSSGNNKAVVVDAGVSTAELIENIVIDDKKRLLLPWTCFYRSKKMSQALETHGKRPRAEESVPLGGSFSESDLPTPIKLRRQITKDVLQEDNFH